MATPAIQTLLTDAQQVLNLNSLSEVRSTMAAALANANVGTPLNPNLTTQQLWDEFYLIVRQPESDIESIITNQLMKFLFAPPAPGGAGANHEVIYNNNGVLAGDSKFLWDDALNKLDIDGSATISGDLTVDTNTLKVVSSTDSIGVGFTPSAWAGGRKAIQIGSPAQIVSSDLTLEIGSNWWNDGTNYKYTVNNPACLYAPSNGSHVWYNAPSGFAAGTTIGWNTLMTLNSTGLGVGVASPSAKLHIQGAAAQAIFSVGSATDARHEYYRNSVLEGLIGWDANTMRVGAYQSGGKLELWSGGSAKATLDASGNLLVGTTSLIGVERFNVTKTTVGSYLARFNNTNTTVDTYGVAITYTASTPNDASHNFLGCIDSVGARALIYANGGLANYSANNVNLSDARTKTDIKPLASYWNKIKALELVTFKYKDQTHNDDNIGLISQQVESVAPEFVSNDGFGETPADGVPLKSIYTTDLYHASIKALQEAMARIEALEAKLA